MPNVGDTKVKNNRVYVYTQPDPSLGPGTWRPSNPDSISGGGGTIEVAGSVDLTTATIPAGAQGGEVYLNSGTGNFSTEWANVTDNATTATNVEPLDTIAYDGTSWTYFGSGPSIADADLGIGNRNATTLDITSSTGTDATVPAATTTLAGLLTGADKTAIDNIGDGTITIEENDGTSLGTFTTNQSGNTTITLPAETTPGDAVLTIEDSTGTSLGTFSANQATGSNTTITLPASSGGGVDLSYTANGNSDGTVTNSGGTDATIPVATNTVAGLMTGTEKQKLAGIDAGAEVNPDLSNYIQSGDNISDLTNDANYITSAQAPVQPGDIPTVGAGVITIQSFGENAAADSTFQMNQILNQTVTLPEIRYTDLSGKPSIPANTSDLTNDSGYITSADVPTATSDLTNDSGFITSAGAPVQPGDLFSGSYNDLTDKPSIPANTSDLTNDSGFITSVPVDSVAGKTGAVTLVKADITDFSDSDYVRPDVAPTFTATVQTTERTITAGAFDLSTGNHWKCGAITVPAPTNAVAGTSGLIRITAGPVAWNTVFKFPGGTAPTISGFPAIVPFYVKDGTKILMGNPVQGIF